MKSSLKDEFYKQQKVVRDLIIGGDSNSDRFWEEHTKMIELQLKLYGTRPRINLLLEEGVTGRGDTSVS